MTEPIVVVEVRKTKTIWDLVVECPYCGRRHRHGGGTIEGQPLLGWRSAHCVPYSLGDYELVELVEAER
jgi:hypothetical protein